MGGTSTKSKPCCPKCGTEVENDLKNQSKKGKRYQKCKNCGAILEIKTDDKGTIIRVKRPKGLCNRALKDFKKKLFRQ